MEPPNYHSISDNISTAADSFEYKNGYFGERGTSSRVRVIYDGDPIIAFGGIDIDLPNGKEKITYMADGSIITFDQLRNLIIIQRLI